MTLHSLDASSRTLHGCFSRDLDPVLTIDPGDTVVFSTLDAGWGLIEQADPFGLPVKFSPRDPKKDLGHALVGPIEIRGAQPGMVLEVGIKAVVPGRWGWSSAGGFPGFWNEPLDALEEPECVWRWAIDAAEGMAVNQHGLRLPLQPFMGILGLAPALSGLHPTVPPRRTGGNIDCKELVPGSTIQLPIEVEGGRFSVGDGHARQGDGEVAGVALECPMERVELEFHLRADLDLEMPRAETPAGWITFGLHEDLNQAGVIAIRGMLQLINEVAGLSWNEALALSSLCVDLRVTQVVNRTCGIHALLPHALMP